MRRKLFKNLISNLNLKEDKSLGIFGEYLHDKNLWHINRRSFSTAIAVGLFCAFVPIPGQMVLAAGLAIIIRCNLPIAVICVWITNPITMPPLFFFAYKVGAFLTSSQFGPFEFELSLNWLFTGLKERWYPFLVGCLFVGTFSGLVGFIASRIIWRIHIISFWKRRKLRKLRKLER